MYYTIESMEKKIVAFENKSHRRLLGITYRQQITNVIVKEKMVSLVGNYVPLLAKSQETEITLVRPHHSTQLISQNDSSR